MKTRAEIIEYLVRLRYPLVPIKGRPGFTKPSKDSRFYRQCLEAEAPEQLLKLYESAVNRTKKVQTVKQKETLFT